MTLPTLILGGGIAGLAAAEALTRRGRAVIVFETEPQLCSHSSGRNAAIFRHMEARPELARLAKASARLLTDMLGDDWLTPCGALYVSARPNDIATLVDAATQANIDHQRLDAGQIAKRAPAIALAEKLTGVYCAQDGIIDIHAVTDQLARLCRRGGAQLHTNTPVRSIDIEGARVVGVTLKDGSKIKANTVINCTGAWAQQLGQSAAAPLPLTPLRRHLAVLEGVTVNGPVIWKVQSDDEVYWRQEGDAILASPCDESPSPPCLPAPAPEALELLASKLQQAAPTLASCRVRRSWACLRTYAPDRNLVIGKDPRVSGLAWLAGLGGHGMTLGVGAAQLLADSLCEDALSDDAAVVTEFIPNRLLTTHA